MFEQEEFNFIDIGSIGGLPKPWSNYAENINFLLNFEPNDEPIITSNSITYNTAVWEEDVTLPFYIYKGFNNTGSSLFKQNYTYVKDNWETLKNIGPSNLANSWFDRSSLIETKTLKCKSLDNILKEFPNKEFHFLKIDAQGAEYNILKGAEKFLSTSCIGLHLELFVIPLYENIILLDDVVKYLETFGFELIKKFPAHGTFNSQHDCLFIHKSRNKKAADFIKKVYDDSRDIEFKINLDFSKKINNLYSHINKLKNSNYKLAIYGNGLIGKIFQQELKDQIVAIFDKNTDSSSNICNISHPNKIFDFDFDKLVISVLGREEEIIKDIQLPEDKIYTISINSKAKDIVFLDKSDKSDIKTIVGPFTKESNISFDETQLLSAYVGDQKNGIMIDVGAHHGSAARPFLEKSWNVYGYEPDPNNRKVLIEKLSIYNSFILSSCAVSDQAGEILDFYASEESTGISGLSSFTENHKKICQVTTTTLTDEINKLDIKNVDFLKIDTEGFDLMVLKGFPWEKMTPNIIECEFEDFKTVPLGYNFNDISNYLVSKGYTVYVSEWYPIIKYGSRHTWKRLFKYDNQEIDKSSWGNLLAFKETPHEESLIELLKEIANIEY